jgi:uncharacterized caspase-like protein
MLYWILTYHWQTVRYVYGLTTRITQIRYMHTRTLRTQIVAETEQIFDKYFVGIVC